MPDLIKAAEFAVRKRKCTGRQRRDAGSETGCGTRDRTRNQSRDPGSGRDAGSVTDRERYEGRIDPKTADGSRAKTLLLVYREEIMATDKATKTNKMCGFVLHTAESGGPAGIMEKILRRSGRHGGKKEKRYDRYSYYHMYAQAYARGSGAGRKSGGTGDAVSAVIGEKEGRNT